jgi:radical SAM protein with 4Fe4S-binding SPASM domain
LENRDTIAIEYDGNFFYLPAKILIENKTNQTRKRYNIEEFDITGKIDLDTLRLNVPETVYFLINNRCVTNCIYCYAYKDKLYDYTIPFARFKELLAEMKALNVLNMDITGGELFLYEHWPELLKEIFDNGYSVYISTKCPLTNDDIDRLLHLGVKQIQISLDSIYEEDIVANLRVNKTYLQKILNTVSMLNEAGIEMKIKSVITRQIYDVQKIRKFIGYFQQYEKVRFVQITVPAHTAYKSQKEFFAYRLSKAQIMELTELVSELKDQYHFNLSLDGANEDLAPVDFQERKESFYKRARCNGNQSSFLILPNGDVTICEETYFNPNLILGNVLENSIMDVWNSDKAKNLYFKPQSDFPEDSPCSACNEFVACRNGTGVCWSDVIAAYGEDKWLNPSPDCHYAPPPKNIIKTWQF